MKRIEIITNQSIEEDLLEMISTPDSSFNYTLIPNVRGRGRQGTREGSALWPERNCLLLLFIEDSQVDKIKEIVNKLKEKFPREGTKLYISQAV
jgi:nitrogen regulatory protein PII